VSNQIDWLLQKEKWKGLQHIVMIEEKRETGSKVSLERRFFISSLAPNAQKIARAVRSHWSVENFLHWSLDLVFNEDASRIRKDNAPENIALV
jgi:predicted transposase YbfD/YdcC